MATYHITSNATEKIIKVERLRQTEYYINFNITRHKTVIPRHKTVIPRSHNILAKPNPNYMQQGGTNLVYSQHDPSLVKKG